MEWSDVRSVFLPALDTLSVIWAACWLANRFLAGSLPSAARGKSARADRDRAMHGAVSLHEAMPIEELALLGDGAAPAFRPDRWM